MNAPSQKQRRNKTWNLRHMGRLRGQFTRKDLIMTPSALARFLSARRRANQIGARVRHRSATTAA